MKLLTPVRIPEATTTVQLRFWSRWDIEPGFDFGQVLVSSDGGTSWMTQQGKYSSLFNKICYTGWQPEWVEERLDLSPLSGRDIIVRFLLTSNADYPADGWYIDDVAIRAFGVGTGVGVADHLELPAVFALEQNYPNPFNPSTTIRYGLPHRSGVQLTVFNTLGQQVALLQNEELDAGFYQVQFNASGLSSGVYFYRLSAGDFMETKRLLLLR